MSQCCFISNSFLLIPTPTSEWQPIPADMNLETSSSYSFSQYVVGSHIQAGAT